MSSNFNIAKPLFYGMPLSIEKKKKLDASQSAIIGSTGSAVSTCSEENVKYFKTLNSKKVDLETTPSEVAMPSLIIEKKWRRSKHRILYWRR